MLAELKNSEDTRHTEDAEHRETSRAGARCEELNDFLDVKRDDG